LKLIKKFLKILPLFFKLVHNMTHSIKYHVIVVDLVYDELNFNVTNYNFSKPDLLPLFKFINTVFWLIIFCLLCLNILTNVNEIIFV